MAGTFTLTGRFKRNDAAGTPYVNSTIRIDAAPFPDTTDNTVYSSSFNIVTDANGSFSITLVTETLLYYRLTSADHLFDPNPFTFLAPTAGTTVDVTDLTIFDPSTITPTVAADAIAARNAAQAAAASVAISTWQPSVAVVAGQVKQAPDGTAIKRISSGTTRATYDATEQALWLNVYPGAQDRSRDIPSLGLYFPEAHGAVGDGVANDTAAVNACFAAASNAPGKATAWLAGTYRTTAELFYWGEVDVLGGGKLINDISVVGGTDFWINAGISAKLVNATPWTGRWEVDFTNTANLLRAGRHHQIHRCSDVTISCVADVRPAGDVPANAFGSGNDGNWCTSPTRERIRFRKTTVLASQTNANTGGEGISVSQCTGVWIEDCWVDGVGDDPIVVHGVTDFYILNNHSKSRDSRLAMFDSVRGKVWGNHHERQPNPNGSIAAGGALAYIGFEGTATNTPACADIDFRGNSLVHAGNYSAITYGLRIVGARRINVHDNRIQTYTNGKAITWEGADLTAQSWVDPEGLDPDRKARLRGLSIRGNIVTGTGTTSGIIDESFVFSDHMVNGTNSVRDNVPGPDGVSLHTAPPYYDVPVFVRQVKPSAGGTAYATLTATTEVPLQFPSLPLEDVPGGAWDLGNNRWNVPVAGLYEVIVTSRMTDAATVRNVQLGVRLGSESSMPPGAYVWRNQGGNRDTMTVTRMVNIAAGDTIQGRIFSDGLTYPLMEASMFIRRIG